MYEITLFGIFKPILITRTYQNIGLYFNNYFSLTNGITMVFGRICFPYQQYECIKETRQQIVDYYWIYKWITLLLFMGLSTN